MCLLAHRLATGAQNLHTPLITPIMENPLEDVRISACRHGLKKIPTHNLTTVYESSACQIGRLLDDLGPVIQRRSDRRIRVQDLGEKASLTTTHIDHSLKWREIISADDSGVLRRGKVR